MVAQQRRSFFLLAALVACACSHAATPAEPRMAGASVEPGAAPARVEPRPPAAAEPTATGPTRAIPRGETVRVAPGDARLVLGTDVVVEVGLPERDAAGGVDRAHVILRAGAEVRDEAIPCDAPFSFHGIALTVEGGSSSFANDHLVGYAIDTATDAPSPAPQCATDADCTLTMFACCGTVCAPRPFHVDMLAAAQERCARRVCAPAPRGSCPDGAPPSRAACVEETCVAVAR